MGKEENTQCFYPANSMMILMGKIKRVISESFVFSGCFWLLLSDLFRNRLRKKNDVALKVNTSNTQHC